MPVYFIQAGENGPVKIGFTESLVKRFDKMRVDCPMPLRVLHWVAGNKATEAAFHARWDEARVRGEWFKPLREIVEGDFDGERLPVPAGLRCLDLMPLDLEMRRAPALAELFARRGAVKAVAQGLNISTAAVSTWRYVPIKRREAVAEILGVPVEAVPVRAARAAEAA